MRVVRLAGCDVALGAGTASVIAIVAPLLAFLGAALTLARSVERSGRAERIALALAVRARGSALAPLRIEEELGDRARFAGRRV